MTEVKQDDDVIVLQEHQVGWVKLFLIFRRDG